MYKLLNALPPTDRRLVRNMAADAGAAAAADQIALEIVRAYLGLVRSAPAALPNDLLRRLAADAIRKGV